MEEPHRTPSAHRLGRYEICSRIAAGGMASVYLARSSHARGVQRIVALKVIHKHLAVQQSFTDMFLDEASIASAFNHPNICSVLDFGEDNGRLYMVMEYLAGESLAKMGRRVAKRKQRKDVLALPALAAHIVAAAADGLHNAHNSLAPDGTPRGVVHRDVSPENIQITYEGAVKVVDFGVAKAENRNHETKVAKIKGKFAYVAPEQLRNDPIDRRADIWGLGVCLWETLVLRRLFRRKTEAATLSAVLFDEIEPPSKVRPWIPESIDPIVMKALARDPDERYSTAEELADDLREWARRERSRLNGAELSRWMKAFFEEEHTERSAALRDARNGLYDPELDMDETVNDGSVGSVSFGASLEQMQRIQSAAEPTVRLRREVSGDYNDLADLDDVLSQMKRRRRWPIFLLLALVGAGAAVWTTPSLRQKVGERLGLIEPPPPVEVVPEELPGRLILGLPEGAFAAAFVGRAPVLIGDVEPGTSVEFLVRQNDQRVVATVPAGAEWPIMDERPTYELAVEITAPEGDGEDEATPSALSTASLHGEGLRPGPGQVRVVTTPTAAKVFRVLGKGRVELNGLDRSEVLELLVVQDGFQERRIFINERRWGETNSLELNIELDPVAP